ncbi:MAG: hypothetical protein LH679_06515, partial [Cyanobacteria bacterium CAN_BIN43]|nr:hypothetical protein [Cyanobacteria bacterium CAN_BIN43]
MTPIVDGESPVDGCGVHKEFIKTPLDLQGCVGVFVLTIQQFKPQNHLGTEPNYKIPRPIALLGNWSGYFLHLKIFLTLDSFRNFLNLA